VVSFRRVLSLRKSSGEDQTERMIFMDELPRLNKNALTVTNLNDIEEEKKYWLSQGPLERIQAIEINRRMVYGTARVTSRLQRLLEVADLPRR
jgi:hypothetical protein